MIIYKGEKLQGMLLISYHYYNFHIKYYCLHIKFLYVKNNYINQLVHEKVNFLFLFGMAMLCKIVWEWMNKIDYSSKWLTFGVNKKETIACSLSYQHKRRCYHSTPQLLECHLPHKSFLGYQINQSHCCNYIWQWFHTKMGGWCQRHKWYDRWQVKVEQNKTRLYIWDTRPGKIMHVSMIIT